MAIAFQLYFEDIKPHFLKPFNPNKFRRLSGLGRPNR